MESVFHFKQFSVKQQPEVFKIGTDAILLGALPQIQLNATSKFLEIGSGTGIISLMLAQRFSNANIDAIEQDELAFQLSSSNFKQSPFQNRLNCIHTKIQEWKPDYVYDHIFCNPPFFENSTKSDSLSHARHNDLLTTNDLARAVDRLLKSDGVFNVIYPVLEFEKLKKDAAKFELHPFHEIHINTRPEMPVVRIIGSFGRNLTETEVSHFTIRDKQHQFSDSYKKATADFHPFL